MGDVQEGVFFVNFIRRENRLEVFADCVTPHWVTRTTMLDYNTVAGGDKFGNVWVERLPQDLIKQFDESPDGRITNISGPLGAPAYKASIMNVGTICSDTIPTLVLQSRQVAHFHTADIPMSMQKTILTAGGREVLLYTTILGSMKILVPFTNKEDVDFFQLLEMHMRSESTILSGRSHLHYRSYHVPVKVGVEHKSISTALYLR